MPLKVSFEARVRGRTLQVVGRASGDLAAILTNLEPAPPGDGPSWTMMLRIGEGPSARDVDIALAPLVSKSAYEKSEHEPVFISRHGEEADGRAPEIELMALFRSRLFRIDRQRPQVSSLDDLERQEVVLRVKRAVYGEEEEINSLKSYVANVEAAREYQKNGPRRDPIPSDVKMLVWSRDGGACTGCGAQEKLHFDHIIPVAKGGGSTAENIQILCETCNLKKSDKI